MTQKQISDFQEYIFSWWEKNKRDLPWRHTDDPYKILVSEVMLQQTQVARVLPKYQEFLSEFPGITELSGAPLSRVLRVWKGMGYNRRALYLQQAAKKIVTDHHGKFPKSEKELLELPGVGLYTARAIQVFAWKKNVSMVDTNIRQILTYFFFKNIPQSTKIILEAADAVLPIGKSWEWHQALMDYGSLELKKKIHPPERRTDAISFKNTPRFIRGRIIDELRTAEYSHSIFIQYILKKYDKPYELASAQLEKLIQEGLVTRTSDGIIRLAS